MEVGTGGGDFEIWGLPLWLSLIVIAVAKMVATSFSIGSGGSGGVFAPGIMIGALLGGSFGLIVSGTLSGLPPETFSYMGMAVLFGAAAKVPLAASVMAAEMGGNYHLIAPTLLAAVIARRASGEISIYGSQLPRRLEPGVVEASILLTAIRSRGVKVSIPVGQLVDTRYPVVNPSTPLAHAVDSMMIERRRLVVVVDNGGRPLGVIDAEDLEDLIEKVGRRPDTPVGSVPLRRPPILPARGSVEDALDAMVRSGYDYVLVTDDSGRYRGVVTIEEIDAALAHVYLEET
jgi:CIC family chloride channel protein